MHDELPRVLGEDAKETPELLAELHRELDGCGNGKGHKWSHRIERGGDVLPVHEKHDVCQDN